MNIPQPINEGNPSNYLSCPHCRTQLPSQAVFCSFCGKRVEQKKNGELDSNTQHGSDEGQGQEAETVRLPSLAQIHLKRWLSYQSLKNNKHSGRSQGSSPSLQDAEEVPAQPISSSRGMASADITQLLEAPIQVNPVPSFPTIPAPSITKTWEQTPVRSNWLWPTIIILSAVAAGLVYFVFTDTIVRPVVVFWFLFVCPGMIVARFLRLKEPAVEWTLAVAMSLAIDAIVAAIQLYAGRWSPAGTLSILIGLCLGGAVVQLASMSFTTTYLSKLSHIARPRKPKIPLAISLAWIERFWEAQWSPRRLRPLISRGVRSATSRRSDVSKRESSVAQPATVAVLSHQPHAPRTRKRSVLWPFSWKHTVEKPATLAVPKRWRASRAWKTGIVLIPLALLIGLGVVAGFWSRVPNHSAIPRPTVTSPASKPTPTPVPTIYPVIAGTYNGTIDDLSSNVSTSLSLTRVQQNQGKISGYLVLGSGLQRSDPFSGTIDTAKHLQLTVTDAAGHATLFFEGVMQSTISLSGDYYQCSPNPTQNNQCGRAPGGYGIWSVALVS